MTTITLEEAQAKLPEVIQKLAPGEELVITQDNRPVAHLRGVGSEAPQTHFQALVRKWKLERGPTSSVTRMAAHPAYREIVGMGKAAVPLLLAELERQPDHWFLALHEITGANPVPEESRGRLKEMAAAWLHWGKENGFQW